MKAAKHEIHLFSFHEYISFLTLVKKGRKSETETRGIWQCKILFDQRFDSHIPIGAKIDGGRSRMAERRSFKLLVEGRRDIHVK